MVGLAAAQNATADDAATDAAAADANDIERLNRKRKRADSWAGAEHDAQADAYGSAYESESQSESESDCQSEPESDYECEDIEDQVNVSSCRRSAASARCDVMLGAKVLVNVTCGNYGNKMVPV